jgi:hypothetical protein
MMHANAMLIPLNQTPVMREGCNHLGFSKFSIIYAFKSLHFLGLSKFSIIYAFQSS